MFSHTLPKIKTRLMNYLKISFTVYSVIGILIFLFLAIDAGNKYIIEFPTKDNLDILYKHYQLFLWYSAFGLTLWTIILSQKRIGIAEDNNNNSVKIDTFNISFALRKEFYEHFVEIIGEWFDWIEYSKIEKRYELFDITKKTKTNYTLEKKTSEGKRLCHKLYNFVYGNGIGENISLSSKFKKLLFELDKMFSSLKKLGLRLNQKIRLIYFCLLK